LQLEEKRLEEECSKFIFKIMSRVCVDYYKTGIELTTGFITPIQLQLQSITTYTLYNTSVELDTRLATVPQPEFHYNTLLASLAIDSSLPLLDSKLD
jgi:hypothetical protein